MDRPNLELIKESLPHVDERIAKGTVTHLIEYIEYLEHPPEPGEVCPHCGGIEGEGESGRCPICGGP